MVHTLGNQPLDWGNALALRLRLILCWRLFALYRSMELARLYRNISFVPGVPFVLVQRKGWPHKRWEEVLVMPDHPALSPWHLLKAYVALTSAHCPAGSEVLRALRPRIN